jgi:hypothetical protein
VRAIFLEGTEFENIMVLGILLQDRITDKDVIFSQDIHVAW